MIAENELRVGNWLHHTAQWSAMHKDGEIKAFNFQWSSSSWYLVGESCLDLELIEPIKITEEWLLRFGFEKNSFSWIKKSQHEDFEIYTDWEGGQCIYYRTSIRYVHELQNIYFAIIREELKTE